MNQGAQTESRLSDAQFERVVQAVGANAEGQISVSELIAWVAGTRTERAGMLL